MPDEPKSPDELLKAYAEQRRQQQGDPASLAAFRRKQLQDEVARTYGSGATGATAAKAGWWTWPRLAWLGVACAVTVVGVLSFNPAKEQQIALQRSPSDPANSELQDNLAANSLALKEAAPLDALVDSPKSLDRSDKAKADSSARPEIAFTPALNSAAPPPAPAPTSARSEETLSRDLALSPAGDAPKLSEQPLTPQLGVALETRQQAALADETKRLAKAEVGREATETKSQADAGAVMLQLADTKDTPNARLFYAEAGIAANQAAASQRYAQVDNRAQYRRNFNSPPPLPVMNQFSVQQNGPQVVIVDADGSQYTGLITNAPALAETLTGQAAAPSTEAVQRYGLASAPAIPAAPAAAAGGVSAAEANNVWFFRVSGTNRSLNQTVVFEGNLVNAVPAELEAIKAQTTQAGVGEATSTLATSTAAAPAQSVNSNAYNFQSSPALSNAYQNFYQNAYQNSQIRGRVTVGGSNQVEINAVPVQP